MVREAELAPIVNRPTIRPESVLSGRACCSRPAQPSFSSQNPLRFSGWLLGSSGTRSGGLWGHGIKDQELLLSKDVERWNVAEAACIELSSTVCSTIALAATDLATSGGGKRDRRKVDKGDLQEVVGQAGVATASIGKFDKKLPGEKAIKNKGKKRKVGMHLEEV